eukprot:c7582_g1_i1.p1 GENE.c7582_g1_i1~~c7582_g1_i1.p1  ORF type:complete len:181 (+),score=40.10 c7582_g1_i1:54-596(+)
MAQWFVVAVVLIVGVNCSRVKPPTKLLPMSKFAESVWQREGEAPVLAERRRAVFVPVRRDYGGARLKMEDRGFLPQLGEERVGPPYDSRPLLETELDDYDKLLSDKREGWLGKHKSLAICKDNKTNLPVICNPRDVEVQVNEAELEDKTTVLPRELRDAISGVADEVESIPLALEKSRGL